MAAVIDLNLDAGELPEKIASGEEAKLYGLVSSINIACGGHAGTDESIRWCLTQAKLKNLAAGAHPSYPDVANFGRKVLAIDPLILFDSLVTQLTRIKYLALEEGVTLRHVKPHGALYNEAEKNPAVAKMIIAATLLVYGDSVALMGLAQGQLLSLAKSTGLKTIHEAFIDRGYTELGTLIPRGDPKDLLSPEEAATQAVSIAKDGIVTTPISRKPLPILADSLCIHGDGSKALEIAENTHKSLRTNGISVKPLK